MNKRLRLIILFFNALLVWLFNPLFMPSLRVLSDTQTIAQDKQDKKLSDAALIFEHIRQGLMSNNVNFYSDHFGKQVYLKVKGNESGYFSANQSYYIIQNFFAARRSLSFKFHTLNESNDLPYAIGEGVFFRKGSRETLQVYVALSKYQNKWVITRFNVY